MYNLSYNFSSPKQNADLFLPHLKDAYTYANEKKHRSPSKVYKNEVPETILKLITRHFEESTYIKERNYYKSDNNKELKKQLQPFLDDIIPVRWRFGFQFNFYTIKHPYGIHCDGGYENTQNTFRYKNFIIPIEADSETFTITYKTHGPCSSFIGSKKQGTVRNNLPIFYQYQDYFSEIGLIEGWDKTADNRNYFDFLNDDDKIFSHGHEVEAVLQYHVGDLISFDSLRYHSAAKLHDNYKSGLAFNVVVEDEDV